jgi:hypothetical protein
MMLQHRDTIHMSWWCLFGEKKLHEHFQECSEILGATKFATELTERENVVKFL